jgi:hypothetical protein
VADLEETVTRIGGDSVNLASNPAGVDIAFYYVNGNEGVATEAEAQARHPGKIVLGIDVLGTDPAAAVRDWENGDKGGSLEQWVIDHNKASGVKDATVYSNRSTIPEVRQLTGSQVLDVDYFLFVSTLDGTLYTGPGVVACQVATIAGYDLSVIWDDGWHPSADAVAHVKANLMEGLRAMEGALAQVAANVSRLPG